MTPPSKVRPGEGAAVQSALTARQRDRSRRLMAAVAGLTTVGAVASVGIVAAVAAQESQQAQAAKAAKTAAADAEADAAARAQHQALVAWAAAHPVVVTQARPSRTVVEPPVLIEAVAPGSARVGSAGAAPRRALPPGTTSGAAPGAAAAVPPAAAAAPAPAAPAAKPAPRPVATTGS